MSKIVSKLKSLGFKSFQDPTKPEAASSFQLRVRGEDRITKYFINVDLYDYTGVALAPDFLKKDFQPDWSVQFNNASGGFNVSYLEDDVDKAIEFYEGVFTTLNCECCD